MINDQLLDQLLIISTGIFITSLGTLAGYVIYLHFKNNGGGGGGSSGSSNFPSNPSFSDSPISDLPAASAVPGANGGGGPFSWIIDFFFPKKLEACCEVSQVKVFCVNEPEKILSFGDFFLSFSCDLIVWSQDTAILLSTIV